MSPHRRRFTPEWEAQIVGRHPSGKEPVSKTDRRVPDSAQPDP